MLQPLEANPTIISVTMVRPARSPIGQRAAMPYIGLAYIGTVTRFGPWAGAIGSPMKDTTSIQQPKPLTSGDFTDAEEPYALFGEWFAEAVKSEPNDPNAMALATVDAEGLPDVRMVLMKGFDTEGFVFYSHIASAKGRELAANPKAALLFHWKSLRRQVRVRGKATPVRKPKPTPISRHGRSRPRSAPGPASNRSRWKAGLPSNRRSRKSPPNTSSARCRGRQAGAAGASRLRSLNSGTIARSVCTTASNSAGRRRASPGPKRGSIPDASSLFQDLLRDLQGLPCRLPPTYHGARCF